MANAHTSRENESQCKNGWQEMQDIRNENYADTFDGKIENDARNHEHNERKVHSFFCTEPKSKIKENKIKVNRRAR